jgi:hypothetical protein
MPRKKYAKEFFIVSAWTTYGMRLYLSNVGFITNGVHHAVWEAGFSNAKEFLTKKEAIENGRVSASDLPGNTGVIVQRHRVQEDGKVEIDQVNTGGFHENVQSSDEAEVND